MSSLGDAGGLSPSSASSAAAANDLPPGGGAGGRTGAHDQRLMLISVCVMSAVATAVTVFALVHCRHAAATCNWRLRGAHAASARPQYSLTPPVTPLQCLCCEVTFSNGEHKSRARSIDRCLNPCSARPPIKVQVPK